MITESYWQLGCDDAKGGVPPRLPTPDGPHEHRNHGYLNGYNFGRSERRTPLTQPPLVPANKQGERPERSEM